MSYLELAKKIEAELKAKRSGNTRMDSVKNQEKISSSNNLNFEPGDGDPILDFETWYPIFKSFHHGVIRETVDFDYLLLRQRNPDAYGEIKAKENQIDALETVRLSELLALLREWRSLVSKASLEQRTLEKIEAEASETASTQK